MKSIISIKGLFKNYGDKAVLKGIDLEISPGQIIAYLGPNGAGKSTTIKILLGIMGDFTGEVSVFGQDIRNAPANFRKRIGYVPEIADLYEVLSGEEYLMFLARIHELEPALAKARMRGIAAVLEIEAALESRMSSYSKGMKQKLMIIASLLHNPDILFWDEPLTGLDANMSLIMKEFMSTLVKTGKTIFYSSHVMEVVEKISDRIIILNDGFVVADGCFEDLRKNSASLNLEHLFNSLTSDGKQSECAQAMIRAMQMTTA